jgi:hypothetical protein
MGFNSTASNKEGGDYERPPTGAHPAYLVGLIDLGTHPFVYQGKAVESHRSLFVWELTAEKMKNGDNFVVAADFSLALGKKSHYRPFIEGWIGRSFAQDESYNPLELVGQPCQITLTEGVSAKGSKFIEVASCCKPMRGLTVPPPTIPVLVYDLDEITSCVDDPAIPEWVPLVYGKKVSDEIKKSIEWGKLPNF